MNCPCCYKRIETSGGCLDCSLQTLWCMCGARFCAKHQREAFEKHPEFCPNIYRANQTIIFPTDPGWSNQGSGGIVNSL